MGGPNGTAYQSRIAANTVFPAHNFNTNNQLISTGPIAAFSNNSVVKATIDKNGFVAAPGYNGNHYGGIVSASNVTSEAAITASAARIIQGWTADTGSNLIVPSNSAGTLTVPTGGDGTYRVTTSFGFLGSASKSYLFYLFKNTGPFGFSATGCATYGTGVAPSVCFGGTIALAAGDTVSVYALSSNGGTVLTMLFGDLFMERIGA